MVYIPQRPTLEEAIAIAQNKDATASQVGYKYATRVQRQSDKKKKQSINSMKSKELDLNKRNNRRKEVDLTIKNAPREKPVSILWSRVYTYKN